MLKPLKAKTASLFDSAGPPLPYLLFHLSYRHDKSAPRGINAKFTYQK